MKKVLPPPRDSSSRSSSPAAASSTTSSTAAASPPHHRMSMLQEGIIPGSLSAIFLTIKGDCLVVRAPHPQTSLPRGTAGRQAIDPVLVLRRRPPAQDSNNNNRPSKPHVDSELKNFQEALNQGDILGNELEVEIEGILGVIALLSGPYLVTIDSSTIVGMAPNYEKIRKITQLGIRPIARKSPKERLGGWRACDEKRYLRMLHSRITSEFVYFCNKYPLYQRMQVNLKLLAALRGCSSRSAASGGNSGRLAFDSGLQQLLFSVSDDETKDPEESQRRYLWNAYLLHGLGNRRIQFLWGTACICGYAESRPADFKGDSITLTLISRRSTKKQGTRFNQRGATADGEVANFVETEMVLTKPGGSLVAHAQLRGSVPLVWSQLSDLSWQPPIRLSSDEGAAINGGNNEQEEEQKGRKACCKHFGLLKAEYGPVHAINLIDSCGRSQHSKGQAQLGKVLAECVQALKGYSPLVVPEGGAELPAVSLTWFDFHKECSHMRWYRLQKLLAEIDDLLSAFGYTSVNASLETISEQDGFFRTNCMDNLDRTNVVQTLLARRILLQALGVPLTPPNPDGPMEEVFQGLHSFEDAFKRLWVANANALSLLYAGTPALKTDFVLTGRMTWQGKLQDGINAVIRYYINNFWDGRRQDSVALLLGDYQPDPTKPSPFPPYCLSFIPGGLFFTISYALQDLSPYHLTSQIAAWITETVLFLLQVTFDFTADSLCLQFLFSYLMFLFAGAALLEALLFVGPLQLMKHVRKGRLFVDKPYLT